MDNKKEWKEIEEKEKKECVCLIHLMYFRILAMYFIYE